MGRIYPRVGSGPGDNSDTPGPRFIIVQCLNQRFRFVVQDIECNFDCYPIPDDLTVYGR